MKILSVRNYFFIALLLATSCTKLDEKDLLYDRVTSDNFGQNDAEIVSIIAAAYTNLYGSFGSDGNIMCLQEVPSDEIVVPTRGPDWGDGGHWVRLKLHTYRPNDPKIAGTWDFLFKGVNTCNRVLSVLEPSTEPSAKKFVSELKALRAIYYYWLLDMYGNVPISTDFKNTTPPSNNTRKEVYDFIEKELLAVVGDLQKTGPADNATYGRVNYYTAQAALAKLYLNAEVYTGTAQWDKAIAACDEVINGGKYTLMANYRDNFIKENRNSTEAIWVIPYDEIQATGFQLPHMTLHMGSQDTYKMGGQPWNGWASVQEFYNSYIDPAQNPGPQGTVVGLDAKGTATTGTVDKRLVNFIVGPQFRSDGVTPLTDGAADATDPDGAQINFTPFVNELQPGAWRQSGARVGKYQFYSGMTGQLSNDWIIFRYADILLTKAEAVARKNAAWNHPTALQLVNEIRTKHGGVDAYTTMTAQTFLAERGREMFFETTRRQDMIRFGTYNSAFRFHPADASAHVNLFPIPETVLNANKNLKQNPGY
ncbi:RagB/SusD family nutrient uptake outer membrane protein [Pseudocnuella soli]|uniref:RagB/SusD family nutrient uptake outer membrane protein n=1 Tax=Pseudocnuella soli TaxID=2502779 RepID=UPI0010457B82|nr:RagB/SusD family nutrient uptake outer membrane protein [Pseudocnuella soli]